MNFVENFFLPPSSDQLHLVKYLLLLIYFIHIPFISLMIGGTFFSLLFRILSLSEGSSFFQRISNYFLEKLIFRKTAGLILGVLPLIVLVLIEGQVFYETNLSIVKLLIFTTILVSMGITLVYFYEFSIRININPFMSLALAGGALFLLLFGYYIFSVCSSLILDPGRWTVVKNIQDSLFSWNVIARYLHFLTASFAVTGAALLFFTFSWNESDIKEEKKFLEQIRKIASSIALSFTLLQPIFIFWNLVTMPSFSLSPSVFGIAVVVLFLIMSVSVGLYKILFVEQIRLTSLVFVLFLFTLTFMLVNDHIARENSIQNHTALLTSRALEVANEIKTERELLMTAEIKIDMNLGKQVYENQCSSCHKFEQKLVGPPYKEVLPKYNGAADVLANFIRKPSKINPDYPQMPLLGLSESEIQSVAAYLLQLEKEK